MDDQLIHSRTTLAERFLIQLKIQNPSLAHLNQKISKTRKVFAAEIKKDSLPIYLGECWTQLRENFNQQYQKIRNS